jgi:hypothetical protein
MRQFIAAFVFGIAAFMSARQAWAGQCMHDAKSTFTDCKNSCKSDLLDARAGCANVSTGCFLACLDGKQECIATVEQPLNDCITTCDAPLDAARTSCKASCGCGGTTDPCGFNSCYVLCLDPAQNTAFSCRNVCKDNFKLDTSAQQALAACKTGFNACVAGCPTPTPTPAP